MIINLKFFCVIFVNSFHGMIPFHSHQNYPHNKLPNMFMQYTAEFVDIQAQREEGGSVVILPGFRVFKGDRIFPKFQDFSNTA